MSPSLHHQLLSQLYKLPLFSLLFPPLQPWLSEHGKRGRYAKRCGIFLSFLAPIANPHKALWPFLHAFHTLRLSLGLLYLNEKLRFSADRFLFFPPGLLTSARCLNKARTGPGNADPERTGLSLKEDRGSRVALHHLLPPVHAITLRDAE